MQIKGVSMKTEHLGVIARDSVSQRLWPLPAKTFSSKLIPSTTAQRSTERG